MNLQEGVSFEVALRLVDLSPGLACVFGTGGRIEYANSEAERILQYSSKDMLEMSIGSLIHPSDLNTFEGALQNSAGEPEFQARVRESNGQYRWLRWKLLPAGGRIFAKALDFTASREESSRHYRRVFEYSKEAIVLIDASDGTIRECNRHTAELLGYTCEELQGQKIWDAPPFRHERVGERLFEAVQHSEVCRMEEALTTRDKSLKLCELFCKRFDNDEPSLIQADIRDISQRHQEAALREREQRFRMLVEGIHDYAIFLLDASGKVSSWNPGAERILQYQESEILGRDVTVLFTPEDRAAGEPVRELETAAREGRAEDERWHLRKDGTRFFASGVMTALRGQDGELRGYVKVMRDVTERRSHEEAMHEAQMLESIGVLAGGIAHDFNNLLTGIIGSASLAAQDLPRGDPARRLMEDVITAGQRAADLTQQLLAYAGKGRFAVSTFDISDAVSDMLRVLRVSIPETVRLEVDLQKHLPAIEADPSQVQQIVFNLLINAVEAVEEHGVVRVSTGSMHLGAERDAGAGASHLTPGEYVFFQVEDTGKGMEDHVKSRIFDPFYTTKFTGRGLGLAAVSGFVRAHSGGIQLMTVPGQGSRFRVLLPVTQRPAEALGTQRLSRAAAGRDLRPRPPRPDSWEQRAQR